MDRSAGRKNLSACARGFLADGRKWGRAPVSVCLTASAP